MALSGQSTDLDEAIVKSTKIRFPWTSSLAAVLLMLFVPLLAGCGDNSRVEVTSSSALDRGAAIGALRDSIHSDYDPTESPEAQRQVVDVAVFGTIEKVYSGEVDIGSEDVGMAFIDVKVAETWKGGSLDAVTLMTPWAADSPTSVDELASGLAPGTKVALFGSPTSWSRAAEVTPGSLAIEVATEGCMVGTTGDSFENVWAGELRSPGWDGVSTFTALRAALDLPGESGSGSPDA